ncbi:MAG: Ribosomal silencing factor RsfS [Elusimicrobia bacterium]|nr:Ribosomal silencing factor RsfS [Elusimicrobiota bacterium]
MSAPSIFKDIRLAAQVADEKLGENILAMDVRKESSLVDCYLLVTGSTHIHIRAIEDAIREALRLAGAILKRTDGQRGHLWRVLDYGSMIIHIMDQKTRDFYAMEKLWERGRVIDWRDDKNKAPEIKKSKRSPSKPLKRSPVKRKPSVRKRVRKKS